MTKSKARTIHTDTVSWGTIAAEAGPKRGEIQFAIGIRDTACYVVIGARHGTVYRGEAGGPMGPTEHVIHQMARWSLPGEERELRRFTVRLLDATRDQLALPMFTDAAVTADAESTFTLELALRNDDGGVIVGDWNGSEVQPDPVSLAMAKLDHALTELRPLVGRYGTIDLNGVDPAIVEAARKRPDVQSTNATITKSVMNDDLHLVRRVIFGDPLHLLGGCLRIDLGSVYQEPTIEELRLALEDETKVQCYRVTHAEIRAEIAKRDPTVVCTHCGGVGRCAPAVS